MKKTTLPDVQKWLNDPISSFDTFISSENYIQLSGRGGDKSLFKTVSTSSTDIYKDMFGKFIRWTREVAGVSLVDLTELDFYRFLTQADDSGKAVLKSAIQFRYVRMIEKVYDYLQISPNPAKAIVFKSFQQEMKLTGKNLQGVALTEEQTALFLSALPVGTAQIRTDRTHAGWKKRRDRALQCVMLGAGLTVAEGIGLHTEEISKTREIDGTLKISLTPVDKHATSYEHVTFMRSELVDELLAWLLERPLIGMKGPFLFPGSNARPLNKSTVYNQVKRTFDRAGLAPERMGGRTLRNTFATQDIDQGTDMQLLQAKLGLAEERSALAYIALMKSDIKKP